MTPNELRGATKKYNALPSYEKVKIDRRMDEITAKADKEHEDRDKNLKNLVGALSKDISSYAYGFVLNGGHLNVPESDFKEDGTEIRCTWCNCIRGAVYRKGKGWYCECCKDEVPGPIEDEYSNYKR